MYPDYVRNYANPKDFTAPKNAAYIEFEGVYHRAEVFLDEVAYPAHPNGYFGFQIPVTEGEHTIRVIAHNSEQPSSRWYSGAGVYRPVTLVSLPKEHIFSESIAVKTLDCGTRKVRVSFKTTGIGTVRVDILDGDKLLESETVSSGAAESISRVPLFGRPRNRTSIPAA